MSVSKKTNLVGTALFTFCLFLAIVSQPTYGGRNLCLWKIHNGDATVYLLGSIHAMREDMYPLPEPILDAYQQSDTVVFEVDLTKLDKGKISSVMAEYGTYKTPGSIHDDLSPKTVDLLVSYLREAKISMDQVRGLRPWLLSVNIGVMELNRLGYETDLGLDQQLQQLALDQGKEIHELESFAQQVTILSGDPIEVQDLALRVSLLERHKVPDELMQMTAAWREGDADTMYQLTVDSMKEYPKLQSQMNRLVFSRNMKMIDKVREYLNTDGRYMVVVGALHMGGPQGLINLLAKDYEVIQVSY